MAKTRAQTANIAVKKEKEEDRKPIRLLHSGSNTRTHNKVAKRKPSKDKDRHLRTQQVKVEEDTDIKSLLQSTPKSLKLPKGQYISQEQINQLIDDVVNHGMSVIKASYMAKMSKMTGHTYYRLYKNDPEKKIPLAQNTFMHSTQEQIKNFIKYINCDKITVKEASEKANMSYRSGHYYYNRYLKDPAHDIPIPRLYQYYTQDQKNEFISYIVNDKMTIKEASKKARMNATTAGKYYHEYFNSPNPDITAPSHIATCTRYTQDQKNEFIGYIVNDKMSIKAASLKARMNVTTAGKYYHEYFNSPNPDITAPSHIATCTRYTQEQIKEVISYIVNDKMSIRAASRKINMCQQTTRKYYRQYLKDHNMKIPVSKFRNRYTQDEINKVVGYITDDKMSLTAASKKANMNFTTGKKFYRRYLNGQKRDTSI